MVFAFSCRARGSSLARQRATQTGSATNRPAAPVLFPRNVFAATDERAQQRGMVARLERSGLLDGWVALASAD